MIVPILVLALLCACLPAASASAAGGTASWEAIAALEVLASDGIAAQNEGARAAAYAGSVDDMILAVQAAGDYVPGTLERHGDFFFWETADGRANGYSPSLRARIQAAAAAEPVSGAASGTEPVFTAGTLSPILPGDPANTADNRNVGTFIPYSDSYYFKAEDTIAAAAAVANSTCGELTVWLQADANVNTLAQAIAQSGILILNGHGTTDYELGTDNTSRANSSYICLPTNAGITSADQRAVTGQYGTYYHAFYNGSSNGEEYYCVDGTCISSHMQGSAPHSMFWIGCCLGMATEGLWAPLQARGVEAMIGFSQAVTTDADHSYRDSFCRSLTEGLTVGEAAAVMKEEVGCPDPWQTAHAPAWPIAVSGQDIYPGRGHVDEEQIVRSTWELYPAWPIEVTLDPPEGGVVTVNRTTLTVAPNPGFTFSGWEITEGNASATQKGSVLSFTLAEPCAVTIHFAARTPAVLSFSAGPGQEAEAIHGYIGDRFSLPAPAGELEADAYRYHFLGWTRTPLEGDVTESPALLAVGSSLTLTEEETALYAVYGYFVPESGTGGQFRRLDGAPEDWAGDYVLTYQSTKALRADGKQTGQAIISPSAVITDTAAGYFIDGDWLNEVPDTVVYELIPVGDGSWLMKMKTRELYLAVTSSSIMLTTATSPETSGTGWKLSWTEAGPKLQNARFTSKLLQYSPTSSGFCTLTSLKFPLTLYKREPGEHRFTQAPAQRFRFDDVRNAAAYYYEPIYWACAHEPRITSGVSPALFAPSALCTRAQLLTFLWHAAGDPEPTLTESPFADVHDPEAYYCRAVLWAWENGITSGAGSGVFGVGRPCTRAQAVTFLWRLAGSPAPEGGELPFDDVLPEDYCAQAVLWACEKGITAGTAPTSFSPEALCTRAQCVTFLYRYLAASEEAED